MNDGTALGQCSETTALARILQHLLDHARGWRDVGGRRYRCSIPFSLNYLTLFHHPRGIPSLCAHPSLEWFIPLPSRKNNFVLISIQQWFIPLPSRKLLILIQQWFICQAALAPGLPWLLFTGNVLWPCNTAYTFIMQTTSSLNIYIYIYVLNTTPILLRDFRHGANLRPLHYAY